MKPVSVIIVNYNGGPLLTECVLSVMGSNRPVEVFVSDNASTDGSLMKLRFACGGDRRLHVIENAINLGFARANNIALPHAKGDFILFLNPDCIIQPDTLDRMIELFARDSEVGMAGCLIRNPDGSEQSGCRRNIPTPWRTFVRSSGLARLIKNHARFEGYLHTGQPMPDAPAEIEAISGAFMMVSSTALNDVGLMDEGYFMHCEDLDWCLRFKHAGWKVMFVPDVEILHVGGVCSATRPIAVEYHKHRGMVRFYRKFFSQHYSLLLSLIVMPAIVVRFFARSTRHLLSSIGLGRRRAPRKLADALVETVGHLQKPARHNGRRVLVTGASSLIGDYLLPQLVNAGFEVHATSRNPPNPAPSSAVIWHRLDITDPQMIPVVNPDILIHLAPLMILPPFLDATRFKGLKRIIAFGSTSVFTKAESGQESERQWARSLKQAEERIAELSVSTGVTWTIFRPTLVYHLGRDKNVTTIATFFSRFRFFPVVSHASGLRQPVHAEDLAFSTMAAIDSPQTFGQVYDLSGGETLTYKAMVIRVAKTLGLVPCVIEIPLPLLRAIINITSLLPKYHHLNPEMATRINRDMCFSHDRARQDFGYHPRNFLEVPTPTEGRWPPV